MTDPEQDDVFEAYLKRRAVLPALDNELEPPAALDEAVLAKAREAIQPAAPSSAPTRLSMGRPARWAVPVALAATILLCLSVVMNISLNTNRPGSSPTLERAAAARADSKTSALSNATAESTAAAGVDAQRSGAAQDRFANNGERPQSVSGEIASREVVLPRAKVAGVPAPRAPVVVESASSPDASAADAISERSTMTASTAPSASTRETGQRPATPSTSATPPRAAAPPAFASTNSERRTVSPYGAASAQTDGASGVTGEASDAKAPQSAADEPRMVAADKAVMMAKRVGVAAPEYTPAPEAARTAGQTGAAPEAARTAGQAAGHAMTNQPPTAGKAVSDQRSAPGVRHAAATPEATARTGGQATQNSTAASAAHPADPKVWLQQINALRAAGKKDQAEAEMRRFKAAFPNYTLPAAPTAPPAGPAPPIADRPK